MDWLRFAVVALAVYKVARTIAVERGPFDVFESWRGFLAKRFGADHWITFGFGCPHCIGFYLGFIGAWFLPLAGPEWFVLTALALSGATSFMYSLERNA